MSYFGNDSYRSVRKTRQNFTVIGANKVVTNKLNVKNVVGHATFDNTVTFDDDVTVNASLSADTLSVGGGNTVYSVNRGLVSVNPGSIGAYSRGTVSVTVSGVNIGDLVVLAPPTSINAGLIYTGCIVSGNDTVLIYLYNTTNAPIDDGAYTWNYSFVSFA